MISVDVAQYIGVLVGSFAVGYSSGFILLIFKKSMSSIFR